MCVDEAIAAPPTTSSTDFPSLSEYSTELLSAEMQPENKQISRPKGKKKGAFTTPTRRSIPGNLRQPQCAAARGLCSSEGIVQQRGDCAS